MSWKDDFANKATEAIDHALVTNAREEFEFNMANRGTDIASGLPAFGLEKVMRTVAVIASALALGIDPDALRLSREEANEAIIAEAQAFAASGTPTLTVDASDDPKAIAAAIKAFIAKRRPTQASDSPEKP